MNIILRELKSNLKGFIIWSFSIIAFSLMAYAEASAFMGNSDISELMSSMPDELMSMFAMDTFDLSTASGYFGLISSYIALALCIYGVMKGCSIITSEERDKTAEFSLVLPITRQQLITGKLRVLFIYGIGLNVVATLCAVVFGMYFTADAAYYEFILLSSLAFVFLQTIYSSLGFCIGCISKNHKKAGSVSVSILLVTYFFSMFVDMHEKLEFLRYFTPFRFFDFYKILTTQKLNPWYIIISLVISVIFIAIGFIVYQKRDIHL